MENSLGVKDVSTITDDFLYHFCVRGPFSLHAVEDGSLLPMGCLVRMKLNEDFVNGKIPRRTGRITPVPR